MGNPGFKSSEVRFEWQTKKFKNEDIQGNALGHEFNRNNYSNGKWDNLINNNAPKETRRSKM